MKKLILSLAVLTFATFLFSQEDSNDAREANQKSMVITHDGLQNDTKLVF